MKSRLWLTLILLALLTLQAVPAEDDGACPLPEDRGTAGILAAIEKLPVYCRVLHITAHPDDESGGTLTWLSRKFHAHAALFCLTRGEGGQNLLGSEKYAALGLVRTGELSEACRHYGTELYFGRAVDFGFSKTAEETLSKWGYEATLGDMVRFIRRWRPSVVISRFQGSPIDGHGHHRAAGILAREAFQAAADPMRFPEQLSAGLGPWKAKKLYVGHTGGEPGPSDLGLERSGTDWTVRVPVGDFDPVLGRSYREIAADGYARHRTQGTGAAFSMPGSPYEYFRLVESSVGIKPKEDSFFDSVETSLNAILDLAGADKWAVSFLEKDLEAVEQAALEAQRAFQAKRPENSARPIAEGIDILTRSIGRVEESSIASQAKASLRDAMGSKLTDFEKALSAVLGIQVLARTDDATGIPGDREEVTVYFRNRGTGKVKLANVMLLAPGTAHPAGTNASLGDQPGGSDSAYRFSVDIAGDAAVTEPFWYTESGSETRYRLRPTGDEFAAFGRPVIRAEARYLFRGVEVAVDAVAGTPGADPLRGPDFNEFRIVPALSLMLDPPFRIAPVSASAGVREFRVSVTNSRRGAARGRLTLVPVAGWRVQPAEAPFALIRKGETFAANFTVEIPAGTPAGNYPVEAVAAMDGQEFRRGYQTISYPGNRSGNIYHPARSSVRIFSIKTPAKSTAGYVPGAGDEIPWAMEQLGIRVEVLSAADLSFGNLNRFPVIVTGIRAYNINEDLRANSRRVLDYVKEGGSLIVQYVRPMERPAVGGPGAPFPFGPYPMNLSSADRITVEDSPIRILIPTHPIFRKPNKITEADFQGWVQERGLYFMNSWDQRFQALLSGSDPGEEPKSGGMLCARYGKGYFVYTGYSWFRQLPAGVPGAFRIFANMISLGR